MYNSKNILAPGIAACIAVVMVAVAVFAGPQPAASQTSTITGYAWSDTIGWISLNCSDPGTCGTSNYGLSIDGSNNITGYAWSENIGWIQFGGLAGFPSGSGTTAVNAHVTGSSVTGWARATAYTDPQAGGWDGWIALSGTGYGLTVNGSAILGYAWGDTNVGWIDFSATYACVGTAGYFCSGNNAMYRDISCGESLVEACSYLCSGGACVPPPQPQGTLGSGTAIKANPSLVRIGGTSVITWGTTNTTSCTVTENNPSITDSWSGLSGTQTTSPINQTTTYTLSCTGAGGTSLTQSAVVRVAPKWQEI